MIKLLLRDKILCTALKHLFYVCFNYLPTNNLEQAVDATQIYFREGRIEQTVLAITIFVILRLTDRKFGQWTGMLLLRLRMVKQT